MGFFPASWSHASHYAEAQIRIDKRRSLPVGTDGTLHYERAEQIGQRRRDAELDSAGQRQRDRQLQQHGDAGQRARRYDVESSAEWHATKASSATGRAAAVTTSAGSAAGRAAAAAA
jgi:hypothetical protein